MREVARHVDAGDRHQLEARIGEPFELLGEHLEHDSFTRAVRGYLRGEAHDGFQPAGLDVEELDVGRGRDEALDRVEHFLEMSGRARDERDTDRGPLPLSWWSTSATETWKRWRRPSTIGRIAARFDFSDRLAGT